MRTEDGLFFAPGIRFLDLNAEWERLPEAYAARMHGFYLDPAATLAAQGHAFAAGVVLVCCIDALALARSIADTTKDRAFSAWVQEELPSFTPAWAEQFYLRFRNGIVHEGRVKMGSEFDLDQRRTVQMRGTVMLINPTKLAGEIDRALQRFLLHLQNDSTTRQTFQDRMARYFAEERRSLAEAG